MAPAAKDQFDDDDVQQTVQPVGNRSRMLIIGVVVAVILLEVILGFYMLPSPKQTAEQVLESQQKILNPDLTIQPDMDAKSSKDTIKPVDQIEFPLPDPPFSCEVTSQDRSATVLVRAKFVLKYDKPDDREFNKRYEAEKNAIRYEINVILRSSSLADFNDPKGTVILNKILKKVNELLGAPIVKSVFYTDFSVVASQ
ncbi:MAG: flagellar basal body-associated FliL family protein [Thermoguttaceae bacterium]